MNYFGLSSIVLHNEINVLVIKFLFGEARVVIYVESNVSILAKGLLFIINITINNAAIIKCQKWGKYRL